MTPAPISRRGFLNTAAMLAGGAAVGCSNDTLTGALAPVGATRESRGDDSQDEHEGRGDDGTPKFDHVVVVMQENRSFDHMLGWVPRADGRQAGLTFVDNAGLICDAQCVSADSSPASRARTPARSGISLNTGATGSLPSLSIRSMAFLIV